MNFVSRSIEYVFESHNIVFQTMKVFYNFLTQKKENNEELKLKNNFKSLNILIPTEIFPSVHLTWQLKVLNILI